MSVASYAESIREISCDLDHLAGYRSKPAELDTAAALAIIATAERLLCQIGRAHQVVADPRLDLAGEIVRLRALAADQEKRWRVDLGRIERLKRDVAERERDTTFWRGEYYALSRRSRVVRRRSPPRRRR